MELIKATAQIIPLDPNPLKHIERIARTCYKSEDKITDESASKFVKMLYDRGHHAMLEFYPFYFHIHSSLIDRITYLNQLPEIDGDFKWYNRDYPFIEASCNLRTAIMLNEHMELFGKIISNHYPELNSLFKFVIGTGNEDLIQLVDKELINANLWYETVKFITSRGVTHELVRHRKCSFAQESTRYCNYGGKEMQFIIPSYITIDEGVPTAIYHTKIDEHSQLKGGSDWLVSLAADEEDYNDLLTEHGWLPQQARGILPNDLKTEIVAQARLSEWKHIFDQRCAKTAHPDMQAIMIPLRDKMNILYDNYFNS
ncbi:MAG: FAD-dependent thymidylate synthase [Candidatus Omnitrophica bacterium]|jgi:thymidylate synthase (FAD)|nr:FAD-dependent thymidylate synthase [Candidatus Omnitrophota bacterium]